MLTLNLKYGIIIKNILGDMVMGVAGVSLLGAIICLYKSIQSIIVFFIWKNKINTLGTVKKLKDKKVNYENDKKKKISSVDYIYELQIEEAGKEYIVEYIETISGNKPSKLQLDKSFPVYFDLNNMQVRAVENLKKDLWQYPLGILMGIAIFMLCLFVIELIG